MYKETTLYTDFLNSLKGVEYYSYRTARPKHFIFITSYERGDVFDKFEERVCREAGKCRDNHIMVKCVSEEGTVLYARFSDWRFALCDGVEVKNW